MAVILIIAFSSYPNPQNPWSPTVRHHLAVVVAVVAAVVVFLFPFLLSHFLLVSYGGGQETSVYDELRIFYNIKLGV